jgi:uncharacterized lipoprotein YmbA
MKKIFVLAVAALLTACGTVQPAENQNNVTVTEFENGTNVTETTVVNDE